MPRGGPAGRGAFRAAVVVPPCARVYQPEMPALLDAIGTRHCHFVSSRDRGAVLVRSYLVCFFCPVELLEC